ncbi:hypothetical protein IFM89_015428 [Coptis chinensis]|uniref:Uncharacterized protein n=1 Tax=Coptis chinensis TaxID=261450 RepID=A0A835IW98_9MAGN|nr:hypothetical protein IFM89_015428 [Coptis chinensis]
MCRRSDCGNSVGVEEGLSSLLLDLPCITGYVEVRRSLHLRLGLPLDRPLLLVANALNFSTHKGVSGNSLMRNASNLLKDVHSEVPSSGDYPEASSLWDGSYDYYHYLQDGFDDSVLAGSYFSMAGALVGLLKPSTMSMFGTLLVIWGLVKEGLLGKPVNTDPAKAC